MSDIMPGRPGDTNPTAREAFVTGLRQMADWLAVNPQVPTFERQTFLLPLHTNDAVVELAASLSLEVDYDHRGNASVKLHFGPVQFQAYGYVDFDATRAAIEERDARAWADKNGMQITVADGGAR